MIRINQSDNYLCAVCLFFCADKWVYMKMHVKPTEQLRERKRKRKRKTKQNRTWEIERKKNVKKISPKWTSKSKYDQQIKESTDIDFDCQQWTKKSWKKKTKHKRTNVTCVFLGNFFRSIWSVSFAWNQIPVEILLKWIGWRKWDQRHTRFGKRWCEKRKNSMISFVHFISIVHRFVHERKWWK